MSSTVPPVIDPSRVRIQEAMSASPFNMFNIVAIVLICVIGFYLYKRFMTKAAPQRRFPLVQPVSAKPAETPVAPIPEEEDEVPDVEDDKENTKEE
jgi:cell division protein FtsN